MKAPVGLAGVTQFEVATKPMPATMKMITIATLMTTITALTRADSSMPITSSTVTRKMISIAGTLITAPVASQPTPA